MAGQMDTTSPPVATHGWMKALLTRCRGLPSITTAVAHPCDAAAIAAVMAAQHQGLITPILVGPQSKIHAAADAAGLDISAIRIEDTPHSHAAAERAVSLVRSGEAQLLMKGSLHTEGFMHAVMAAKTGLRTDRRISHVYVMEPAADPDQRCRGQRRSVAGGQARHWPERHRPRARAGH